MDVAEAIGPLVRNPSWALDQEKIHEEMTTSSDSFSTIDLGAYFAILPSDGRVSRLYDESKIPFERVPFGFAYNSGDNSEFISAEQLRDDP